MKTTTLILASMAAAGAQARPFDGLTGDMSLATLFSRGLNLEQPVQNTKQSLSKDTQNAEHHVDGLVHEKVQAKLPILGDVCVEVVIDGTGQKQCKAKDHHDGNSGGNGGHNTNPPPKPKPTCEASFKLLEIKVNGLLSEKKSLQTELAEYKHKVIDYEHQLSLLKIHADVKTLRARGQALEADAEAHVTVDDSKHHTSHAISKEVKKEEKLGKEVIPGHIGHDHLAQVDAALLGKNLDTDDIDDHLFHDGKKVDYTVNEVLAGLGL